VSALPARTVHSSSAGLDHIFLSLSLNLYHYSVLFQTAILQSPAFYILISFSSALSLPGIDPVTSIFPVVIRMMYIQVTMRITRLHCMMTFSVLFFFPPGVSHSLHSSLPSPVVSVLS
jgi:hypothetical protein